MARTVPSVPMEQTGNLVTAQLWNSGVQAVNNFLSNKPSFRALSSAGQSIPNNTWGAIQYDTVLQDTDAGHSATINNTRYTCQVAGVYWVKGSIVWNPNSAAASRTDTAIAKNGSTFAGSATFMYRLASEFTAYTASTLIRLNAGDYVELWARQFSGVTFSPPATPPPDFNVLWVSK
jgi:hypothetical protein